MLVNNKAIIGSLKEIFSEEHMLVNEPMDKHTSFRIGGKADYLVFPSSIVDIKRTYNVAKNFDVPITLLGNGSNVLVGDKGIRGIVIQLGTNFSKLVQEKNLLKIQAGAILGSVAQFAAKAMLSGLEFAVGIPGSVGGAIFMNAGAYGGEIKNLVKSITALTVDGRIKHYFQDDAEFDYRHSVFQKNADVICEVELELAFDTAENIRNKMNRFTEKRISKQPLEWPSAGSTFKRPPGGFAGPLIEQAGLKGYSIGNAQVSTKHAGFIVNTGNATASDVLQLIKNVQKVVSDRFSIILQPEVKFIGEF